LMAVPAGFGYGYARSLRREIIFRNRRLVEKHALASISSYGQEEVVVYACSNDGASHGNFFPESYAAILKRPEWRRRLKKPHTGRRHLPRHDSDKWRELDSCTSSDALLMNIFCHPRTLAEGKLHRLMGVSLSAQPEFGVRVAAPLNNSHRDRTEIDMRLGDVLVEAKLTESDFQTCRAEMAERYGGFPELFHAAALPRVEDGYAAYQLIRSVLAAHASGARFCVIADIRRPDLREQWFRVMESIRDHEMRLRCQMLTWQEISAVLPDPLRTWLGEKYGIFAPGSEPQLDASDWYW
jgi:hypothetical protein